jgi:hypothetical protein
LNNSYESLSSNSNTSIIDDTHKLHILELCDFFRRIFHILHTEIWPGQDYCVCLPTRGWAVM